MENIKAKCCHSLSTCSSFHKNLTGRAAATSGQQKRERRQPWTDREQWEQESSVEQETGRETEDNWRSVWSCQNILTLPGLSAEDNHSRNQNVQLPYCRFESFFSSSELYFLFLLNLLPSSDTRTKQYSHDVHNILPWHNYSSLLFLCFPLGCSSGAAGGQVLLSRAPFKVVVKAIKSLDYIFQA